jgi:hypothetical protein
MRAFDAKFKGNADLARWYRDRDLDSNIKGLTSEPPMKLHTADKLQWFLDHLDLGPGPVKFCMAKGRTLFTLFPTGRASRALTEQEAAVNLQKTFRGFFSRSGKRTARQEEEDLQLAMELEEAQWHMQKKLEREREEAIQRELDPRYAKISPRDSSSGALQAAREAQAARERPAGGGPSPRGAGEAQEGEAAPPPRPVGSAGRVRVPRPSSGNLETVKEEGESEREDSPGDKPKRTRRRSSGSSGSSGKGPSGAELDLPPPPPGPPLDDPSRAEYVPGRSMGASRRG